LFGRVAARVGTNDIKDPKPKKARVDEGETTKTNTEDEKRRFIQR